MTDKDPIYEWLKGEVDLYNRIVHEGPIDHYTPLGYKRLVQLHAIASRLSTRFIQKKTLSQIDDPPILERITHYTSLYDTANRFTTADNYDTLEDVLYATKENLHQLMIFLNDHLELNFNLEPQPQTKTGPSVDEQLSQINTAIENGERPRPC
ncbi:MAG: hypothetical protein KAT70_03690 [Thermoplasmata archaeon]|nr:hypothetical protein [Thermoplasmata archaeon]